MKSGTVVGMGVDVRNTGLPVHNPEPSTPRGKRRHEKRNEAQKAVAKKAWDIQRSNHQRVRGLKIGKQTADSFTMKAAA